MLFSFCLWTKLVTITFSIWIYKNFEKAAYFQNSIAGPFKKNVLHIYYSWGSYTARFNKITSKLFKEFERQYLTERTTFRPSVLYLQYYPNPDPKHTFEKTN